uniref:amino acid transporter AVT1E-like isoform X2 n=1 Tax=Styela clava TaxID=7725 RepID=UPI001939D87C|nr:amino acid transporter AVT1E-like isoform X2 [Styela clava]
MYGSTDLSFHGSTFSLSSNNLQRKNEENRLGIATTALFIVGTMCGTGVLTIPQAVVNSGYIGPAIILTCGIKAAYTGTLLGKCWAILRNRYPEYENDRITDPYPTIAHRAGGRVAEIATRVCLDITMFGTIVLLLLISSNISDSISDIGHHDFSLCYIVMITTGVLIPLSWLGTPKDFWQAGIIAACASIVAAFFVFGSMITSTSNQSSPEHAEPQWSLFLSAAGTILFSFGGASCFPTIQLDMRRPSKFPISAIIGISVTFLVVMSVYLLVGITGFVVLGDNMKPNVLNALPGDWMSYTVNILVTSHFLMAYLIFNNPVSQEIEGILKIPDKFCLKRVLLRTTLALTVMFVALTVPHFDVILSLLGGTTIVLVNFVFPPMFYIMLSKQRIPSDAYGPLPSHLTKRKQSAIDSTSLVTQSSFQSEEDVSNNPVWTQVQVELHVKVILIEIIIFGIVGGGCSTYFSIASLVNGKSGFTVPCYVNTSVGL